MHAGKNLKPDAAENPRPLSHAERFARLDAHLAAHESLWRSSPHAWLSKGEPLPWEAGFAPLAEALRALPAARVQALHEDAQACRIFLRRHLPVLDELAALVALPDTDSALLPRQAHAAAHVGGRKLEQIRHFESALPTGFAHHAAPEKTAIIDWCAGKGHLARWLSARDGRAHLCLERDEALCTEGQRLAGALPLRFQALNVMDEAVRAPLRGSAAVLALHACGDLHTRLLRLAVEEGVTELALAPCCYNRTQERHYRPLSALAREHARLELDRDALRLPLLETVTATGYERRETQRRAVWRLAAQQWCQEVGIALPVESPHAARATDFPAYLRSVAPAVLARWAGQGKTREGERECERRERQGARLLSTLRALELPRAAFRRAIEVWLVLDMAVFLEEAGYDVQLMAFCPRTLTPRNILLHARRPACGAQASGR